MEILSDLLLRKSGLPLDPDRIFHCYSCQSFSGKLHCGNDNGIRNYGNHACSYGYQYALQSTMCCAICGGATALSHVNDAGFWLVGTFLEIDEKTTLKSWTIMETLIGVTALIVSLVISDFLHRRQREW